MFEEAEVGVETVAGFDCFEVERQQTSCPGMLSDGEDYDSVEVAVAVAVEAEVVQSSSEAGKSEDA